MESVKKYKPTVLIIFHTLGIKNNLLLKTDWFKKLDKNTILIEDCVHRIVDPNKVKFIKQDHFIIDSLRKVVPLQGSVVYAQKKYINFSVPTILQSFRYATSVTLLWATMNLFWVFSQLFFGTKLSVWLVDKANKIMKTGYDLIGNSIKPARGFFIFDFLQQFIDIENIQRKKRDQIEFYEKKLADLPENIFQKVPYENSDKAEMVAYPLVLSIKNAANILSTIRRKGLLLDFELDDSQWSKKQKIIYLPIGPYLTNRNMNKIVDVFTPYKHLIL